MKGNIRKRGEKWYYSFEIAKSDGKRKRIERVGGSTKKEAQLALAKAISEYSETGKTFKVSEISVSDYFDYWIREYVKVNCRFNTQLAYIALIENHIKPAFLIYKLKDLSPSLIQEFINKKFLSGFSRSFLVNLISVLGSALKFAVHPSNFIKDNPIQYINFPKYSESRKEINRSLITKEQFKKIITRFDENSKFHTMLLIGYYTGARIGEVTSLTWNDIDFKNKTITFNKTLYYKGDKKWCVGPPKTPSSVRKIKIGETLLEYLKKFKNKIEENKKEYGEFYINNYLTDDDYDNSKNKLIISFPASENTTYKKINFVCVDVNGEMVNANSFKYAARVIHYELGLKFNFHSLRHTHATVLIEQGANMVDVQKRLGHSRISTTIDTYTHQTEEMSKNSVELFEKFNDDI